MSFGLAKFINEPVAAGFMDIGTVVDGIWQSYETLQRNHSLIGAVLDGEVAYVIGDIGSQLLKERRIDWRKVRYTAALAPTYGLAVHGVVETGDIVGKIVSEHPLVKAALGPNLFGNLISTYFFVNNQVGERQNYNIRNLVRHYAGIFQNKSETEEKSSPFFLARWWDNFKEDYLKLIPPKEYAYSVVGTLTAWNGVQYFNFAHVPEHLRTSVTLGCCIIWTIALSLWSLTARNKTRSAFS